MTVSKTVHLKFLFGEKKLFSFPLSLSVRNGRLSDSIEPEAKVIEMIKGLEIGFDGYLYNLLPVNKKLKKVRIFNNYIRYVPRQYMRHYIDFSMSKDAYLGSFSSKSRSGLNRKVKKFAKLDGQLDWKEYRLPCEMDEFFTLASGVSAKTYQEKLLNAGLPSDAAFVSKSKDFAKDGLIRAYVLNSQKKPVAYLFCPAENDALIYAHLGYDPKFSRYSPGTVLHWIVFQELFDDGDFRYFDFTQGEGDHKKKFATHAKNCCDVYYLKKTVLNFMVIWMHFVWENVMAILTQLLDKIGLKTWLKKVFRRI